jgi:hypothetical protein
MRIPQTIEDKLKSLRQNETFQNLSLPKRKFVVNFVENGGDKVKAGFATSENVKSEQAALNKAYQYLKDPVVVSLLRIFSDPGLREPLVSSKELLQMTSQRLRDRDLSTIDFLRLTDLYHSLSAKRAPRSKPVTIDEQVLELEKKQ